MSARRAETPLSSPASVRPTADAAWSSPLATDWTNTAWAVSAPPFTPPRIDFAPITPLDFETETGLPTPGSETGVPPVADPDSLDDDTPSYRPKLVIPDDVYVDYCDIDFPRGYLDFVPCPTNPNLPDAPALPVPPSPSPARPINTHSPLPTHQSSPSSSQTRNSAGYERALPSSPSIPRPPESLDPSIPAAPPSVPIATLLDDLANPLNTLRTVARKNNLSLTQLNALLGDPAFIAQRDALAHHAQQQTRLVASIALPLATDSLARAIARLESDIADLRRGEPDSFFNHPYLPLRWEEAIRRCVHLLARLSRPLRPEREQSSSARAIEVPAARTGPAADFDAALPASRSLTSPHLASLSLGSISPLLGIDHAGHNQHAPPRGVPLPGSTHFHSPSPPPNHDSPITNHHSVLSASPPSSPWTLSYRAIDAAGLTHIDAPERTLANSIEVAAKSTNQGRDFHGTADPPCLSQAPSTLSTSALINSTQTRASARSLLRAAGLTTNARASPVAH